MWNAFSLIQDLNSCVDTFPKGISLKVNAIVWLKFKFTYYNVTVHQINN